MSDLEKIIEISKTLIGDKFPIRNQISLLFKEFIVSETDYPIIKIGASKNNKPYIEIMQFKDFKGKIICPYMKFTGRGNETVNQVAKRMLFELKDWHIKFLVETATKEEKIEYLNANNWMPLWTNNYWVVKNKPYTDWSGIPLNIAFYNTKSKEFYGKDK